MKYLFVIVCLFSQTSFAVTIKNQVKKTAAKGRTTANAEAPEAKVLADTLVCVKSGGSLQAIRDCSKDLLDSSLKASHKDRLLSWFELPIEISYPDKCSLEDTEDLPAELTLKAKTFLCAQYSIEDLNKKVIFIMSIENGKPRLLNIKN